MEKVYHCIYVSGTFFNINYNDILFEYKYKVDIHFATRNQMSN